MHRIKHGTTTRFCKDDFKKLDHQYPINYTQNRLYCKKQYGKSTSRYKVAMSFWTSSYRHFSNLTRPLINAD